MAALQRAHEREHLLERLHELRRLVPAFAEELASTRRQAATLRVENRRLLEQVRRLQRLQGHEAEHDLSMHGEHAGSHASGAGR
ncbi:MAG TPA: hypothetical protein VMG62_07155 [Solirubrobacteraceae bacterium]|nr:hypothetical protein [Solirubrobacteraceae bacterium]